MTDLTIGSALGVSILGIIIVFLVLVLLMVIIFLMSKIYKTFGNKGREEASQPVKSTTTVSTAATSVPTTGSCGEIKLHGIPPRKAAMVMAIVADQLDTPLNELRFISIREVK